MSNDNNFCASRNNTSGVSSVKISYETFFTYEHIEKEKQGRCKICASVIKMKNSNTSGLKKHLNARHKKEFKQMFPTVESKQKKQVTKNKTIESFFSVSKLKLMLLLIAY